VVFAGHGSCAVPMVAAVAEGRKMIVYDLVRSYLLERHGER